MKLNRKQLRLIINKAIVSEHMIKPSLPPSAGVDDNMYGGLETLALSPESDDRSNADMLASTLGYPEDRLFSVDLDSYENIIEGGPSRLEYTIGAGGQLMTSILPEDVVDAFIEAYDFVVEIERRYSQGNYIYDIEDAEAGLTGTAELIFRIIENDIGPQLDCYDMVFVGATGYRARALTKAWQRYEAIDVF